MATADQNSISKNEMEMEVEHREAQTGHYSHTPEVKVALHHDAVAAEAIGGDYEGMPKGYYTSKAFIGTLVVSTGTELLGHRSDIFQATCLAQISGYLGWVLPANTLLLINQSLGGSPNITWVALAWTMGFTIGLSLVGRLSDSMPPFNLFRRLC